MFFSAFAKRRKALAIEADLPLALRSLATRLGMGISFERAMEGVASENYSCSPEFSRILRNVRAGTPVREALSNSAAGIDSFAYKRALGQLSAAYEEGTRGEELKRTAEDLVSQQMARDRENSARLSLATMLFIATSCILPALLLSYLVVGSSFLQIQASPAEVWLIFLALFPLLNLAIIAYASLYSANSSSASAKASPAFSNSELVELATFGGMRNGRELRQRLLLILLASIALSASAFYATGNAIAFVLIFAPALYYFWLQNLHARRNADIEKRLPDALMRAAAAEGGHGSERIFDSIAGAGFGPLSEEFSIARNQVRAGASFKSALASISARSTSPLLVRACSLMSAGYSLGSRASGSMREAADDMLSVSALMRERSSTNALHKYTLLAGGLLVPFILGTLLNAVGRMGSGSLFFTDASAQMNARAMLEAAAGASLGYVAIYALLCSLLIAQTDGNWRRFMPYAIFLAPISLAIFLFSREHAVFSFLS
jgi:Flp pilus assembly protein TadB